jgi:hypothetical protein
MPLIEQAAILRDLLRPASTGEPSKEHVSGTLAGGARAQPHRLADGSGSLTGILGPEPSLHDILSRRRSVRAFSPEPAPAAELGVIADTGLAAGRRLWPEVTHRSAEMIFILAALNVTGLAPGLYLRAVEAPSGFSSLGHEPAWIPEFRQRYADAPALLLVCGDADGACRAMGKGGYGQILIRAAAAGYTAWLRAVSLGLAGAVFGGSCHQVTASLSQAGYPHLWHLFTLAAGIPARYSEGVLPS